MKPSFNLDKKKQFPFKRRALALALVFVSFFSILFTPLSTVRAQAVVSDPTAILQRLQIDLGKTALGKITAALLKAGAISFQQLMKTALNKIAYDTATYIGSGGKGQKPLFVTQGWGTYLVDIADQSTGQFVETFVNSFGNTMVSQKAQTVYGYCTQDCDSEFEACLDDNTVQTIDIATGKAQSEETDYSFCGGMYNNCVKSCREKAASTSQADWAASTNASSSATASIKTSGGRGSIINVCEPSSVQVKLKIALGLSEVSEPNMPNCSATELVQNWGDEYKRLTSFEDPNFLNMVENVFNPVSNDLGIYMTLKTDLTKQVDADVELNKTKLTANQGWLDVRNIAGDLIGTPFAAKTQAEQAQATFGQALLQTTGDIVVDAANLFLNQISLSAFNNLMATLGQKAQDSQSFTEYSADPTVAYGEGSIKEAIVKAIPLNIKTDADYNVLIGLAACSENKDKLAGPTECVINSDFLNAIVSRKTVAEAIKDGNLNRNWVLTKDNVDNAYTLRNISILRKYRILPLAWEQAIERIYEEPTKTEKRQKATLMDLVVCFEDGDEYGQDLYSRNFDKSDEGWCAGLIDPNWVLKAPLGYCAKEGIGGQVIFGNSTAKISQDGVVIPSVYSITRADGYCADEKTCIKENASGGCDAYGYCNEEKRIWKFNSNTCEPVYNTCQTFTNTSNRQQVSYLQNTLDYGDCNADNAGCSRYSLNGDLATSTGMVTWDAAKSLYLTNVESCNKNSEGCTELVRVKPTWGANLVMNAGFSNDKLGDSVVDKAKINDWPLAYSNNSAGTSRFAKIADAGEADGSSQGALSLMLSASGSASPASPLFARVYSNPDNSLLPANFQVLKGESYTLSADVYVASGEKAIIYLGTSGTAATAVKASTTSTGRWERLVITRTASDAYVDPLFGIEVIDARTSSGSQVKVYIKNIKFELSNVATDFSLYSAYRVYQKLIPPYLENICYVNNGQDYNLKADAPAICNNFIRRCNADEAGCESFVNIKKGLKISAKVTSSDYCSNSCIGYDMYISRQDYFNPAQAENIIPTQMVACSSAAVGCNEFTNLDAVNLGGEGREYYSELKQCIKPNANLCSNFYSWERTANGSQLREYSLQKDASGNPKVTADDQLECNADIFKKLPGDPLYNPDCKEFYNVNGQISYHLLSKTITCSENCVSYRLSAKNYDYSLTSQTCSTQGSAAHWDAAAQACQVCLNGGTWDNQLSACIYQAIPGEGQKCSANQNGCREYNGNDGNNIKILGSYSFETGLQGWTSNCTNGTEHSDISSNKNGHSLFYKSNASGCSAIGVEAGSTAAGSRLINKVFASDNVAAQLKVGQTVAQGKSYTLRFIAKSDQGDAKLKIYFYNNQEAAPQAAYFGEGELVVKGGNAWNIYQVNLGVLNHEVSSAETLVISADKDFYFDDVVLTEISDRYYLIKGSGQIPSACFSDINGNYQGDKYNLGCSAYTDRAGNTHSLRKFSSLCSDSAVGCEQMIKTQNYDSSKAGIWNDGGDGVCGAGDIDCVKVPADEAIYAIYEKNKACNSADKGCSLLGQVINGTDAWSDVYKKNNPNKYDNILCRQSELGCAAWSAKDGGTSYFKDPGNQVCQYRSSQNPEIIGKSWYLVPVSRCDMNDNGTIESGVEMKTCGSDKDCGEYKCIVDNNDYPCETSLFKTFGLGGAGNAVYTPINAAGLCEAAASGCTEYIDPVSHIAPNLINDPEYKVASGGYWADGKQIVNIEPNKLYSFSLKGGRAGLSFDKAVKELLSNNRLGEDKTTIFVESGSNITFFSLSNTSVTVAINTGTVERTLVLKEVMVNYQLKAAIDKKSCTSVNVNNGCVLFNERSVSGSTTPVSLVGGFDAFTSENNKAPVNCQANGSNCNANSLIKVSPDRVCAKWLDCISYTIDDKGNKVCYAVGECNRLEGTTCVSYEAVSEEKISSSNANKNATGYLLLNRYHLANMKEVGLNTDAHYDFEDAIPVLTCTKISSGGGCNLTNTVTELLVREPAGSPASYPANGKTYLRVKADTLVSPQADKTYTSVMPNKDYYLNLLVNTEKGSDAFVRITVQNGATTVYEDKPLLAANTGWSRRVVKFTTVANTSGVRIELGSKGSTGEVFFDDINIEPVLQVGPQAGPNEYISKECRLYPTTDSLTCVNKNDTTVKDGLEGYCLEHDLKNPGVCLMWYPVDKISSAQTSRNSLGYQGKYPLNYCTEVDGNFDLVKKLEGKQVSIDNFGTNTSIRTNREGGCYLYDENSKDWKEVGESFWSSVFTKFKTDYAADILKICPNEYKPIVAVGEEKDRSHSFMKVMCLPKEAGLIHDLKLERTIKDMNACNGQTYYDGWTKYNGALNKVDFTIVSADPNDDKANGVKVCQESKSMGETNLWCQNEYKGINEGAITDPVRVLDYNRPPASEDDLKLITGNDPDKTFRLGCNNFIQMVDAYGENKAWADRVSTNSLFPTSTPNFFIDSNVSPTTWYGSIASHNLQSYGRNREEVPFGAALLPDSFNFLTNQGKINLRNQYSTKNKETVLAGRPYGCSNYKESDSGAGCNNIGYCSLNPNVYCLTASKKVGELQISVDNYYSVYVNGKLIGQNDQEVLGCSYGGCWYKSIINVKNFNFPLLEKEKNVLAIQATDTNTNDAGDVVENNYWGIAAAIDGIMTTNSTSGWKCTADPQLNDNWRNVDFNDSSWPTAVFSPNTCSNCGSNKTSYKQIWATNGNKDNSTIYCRYTFTNDIDGYVSQRTCSAGGFGTCVPLWNDHLGKPSTGTSKEADYSLILSQLFLKSYGSYAFSGETYTLGGLSIDKLSSTTAAPPIISGVKLGGKSILYGPNNINIPSKGLYRLELNTIINPERQPLREIYINWGDKTSQVIKGEDNRPDASRPHVIYHYYSEIGTKSLQINIKDNWNQAATFGVSQ